ncbi:MAG: ABC transporter ATP-binding protein [Kofleriaceae bacterium]
MTHAIELTGLTKTFDQVQAVSDLTLRVEPGQVLGFLGPNGAGKTTTIKAICGLIKPTAGEIRLNGFDVARQRRQAMRQFGAVLEGSRSVYWRMSAWDNLLYFGRLKGASGSKLKERAETMLRELELWDRKDDLVGSFSRGMQQKVSIACALAADPPIVLLDEPTLGLDLEASRVVKAWVQRLVREHGKTVVLTTHQLDLAEELSDRVAIIRRGKLLADRPVGELLSLFRDEAFYELRLGGTVAEGTTLPGLTISSAEGHTTLTGSFKAQDELYQALDRVRALGVPLVSVARVEPDLEEVFARVLKEAA